MIRRLIRRPSIALATALTCVSSIATSLVAEEPLRTWTDAGARYRIEARLVGHEGEMVRLEKADGGVVEIELKELSVSDRAYVTAYDAGNPFLRGMRNREAAMPAKPDASTTDTRRADARESAEPASPAAEPIRAPAIDWSEVPLIGTPLQAKPDSLKIEPATPGPALAERIVKLPAMRDPFDGPVALIVDQATGTAAFCSSRPIPREASTTVLTVNLVSGETIDTIEMSAAYRMLACDPAAKRVLMASRTPGAREPETLEVWSFDAEGDVKTFVAEPEDDRRRRSTKWGAFLSGDRFASLSDGGRFAVWSLQSGKPVATIGPDEIRTAATSPNRSCVALGLRDGVTFLDVETLVQSGRLPGNPMGVDALAFSPEGGFLAATMGGKAIVWKTEDLSQVAELACGPGGAFLFADEERIYSRNRLIDVGSGRVIVEIGSTPDVAASGGGFVWLCAEDKLNKVRTLVSVPALPQDAVGQLVALPPQERATLLAEAEPIRIDVAALPDDAAREAARKAIEAMAKESGHSVEENAAAVLVASEAKGKEVAYQYTRYESRGVGPRPLFVGPIIRGGFGPFGAEIEERREVKIAPVVFELNLMRDGQTLWSEELSQLPRQLQNLSGGFVSAGFQIPEGKTVDDIIKEIQTPNYERFGEIELPEILLEPEVAPPSILGTRRLTTTGLR